jgi:hypothetical protein
MAGRLAIIGNCVRQEEFPEGCADRLPDCTEQAQTTLAKCGQQTGLLLSCPETCAACPHYTMLEMATRCEDKHEMCAEWTGKGECANNVNFMLRNCQFSCGDLGARVAWMALRTAMQQGCTRPEVSEKTQKDEL